MSKTISLTIPDPIYAALCAKGAPLDMDGQEYLKQGVFVAGMTGEFTIRLDVKQLTDSTLPTGTPDQPAFCRWKRPHLLPLESPSINSRKSRRMAHTARYLGKVGQV